MTDETAPSYRQTTEQQEPSSGLTLGFIVFASVLTTMAGGFRVLTGPVAIFDNEFHVETRNYLVKFDATTRAMTVIALDIFIIWARAAHGRGLAR